MPNHRLSRLGLAVMTLALLGACSNGDDDAADPTTTTAGAPTAGSGEAADCAGADGETITVEIGDFEFIPERVSVQACDDIVWTNGHDQAHTSTSSGDVSWNTGNIAPGADADPIVFDTPGEYAYTCALHPFMTGTVAVS